MWFNLTPHTAVAETDLQICFGAALPRESLLQLALGAALRVLRTSSKPSPWLSLNGDTNLENEALSSDLLDISIDPLRSSGALFPAIAWS
mmetsp:Transcript_59143/g.106331  ORF Transcript_59143/g.106331 Transcript_59143/m.106331 type:complete len:90 (-) Transcript_59143:106-375(-)